MSETRTQEPLTEVDLPSAERSIAAPGADGGTDISEIINAPPPRVMHTLLYAILGLIVGLLFWAYFGRYNVVISARGTLVPADPIGLIQADSLARVTQILHRDGDQVAAGEPVVALQRLGDGPEMLTAPVAGRVSGLSDDRIGALVQPGQQLAEVLPDGPMVARVQIPNDARGRVRNGMHVKLKIDTFPYQQYGAVDGTLTSISEMPIAANAGAGGATAEMMGPPGYEATVVPDGNDAVLRQLGRNLTPGLALTADIVVQQRRILDMLLEKLGS
jgi:multidrug efflux pump subunit AcrA (membrane-fusion protein)